MSINFDFQSEMTQFFSSASSAVKEKGFEPLGLSNDEMSAILSDRHGLTNTLVKSFPELCFRDKARTRPRSFMEALYVWETYTRKSTIAELSTALKVKATSIPQYMYTVRDALNSAFGLDIICEGDTYKLMSMDDLRQRSEHLGKALESYGTRLLKVAHAVQSLEASGYSDHPELQAVKLGITNIAVAMNQLTGEVSNPEIRQLAASLAA